MHSASRFEELDEQVRSAASFALYAANPKTHLGRLVRPLSDRQRSAIVQNLHYLASSSDPHEQDRTTFVARRVLDDPHLDASEITSGDLDRVRSIIDGSDAAGAATLIGICLLRDSESVVEAVENALTTFLHDEVKLPEQGASILAGCDFSSAEVTKMETLPSELSQEVALLPIDEYREDYKRPSGYIVDDDDDSVLDYRRLPAYGDEIINANADPFFDEMREKLKLLPSVGDLTLVVPQNLDQFAAFTTNYQTVARRVLETQNQLFPSGEVCRRLGFAEVPRGLVVPLRQLATVRSSLGEMLREAEQSHEYLLSLSPTQFEHFMASVFRGLGYDVEETATTRDGGADLLCLQSRHGIPFRVLVEVKRYKPTNRVGVSLVRSFVGANQQFGADRLVFVTTSDYTKPAIDYANQYASQLLLLRDYDAIREWCRDVRLRQGL